MSNLRPDEMGDETPTVEVRALRYGRLIATQLCESIDEAAALVTSWEDIDGISCEITDLSAPAPDESAAEAGVANPDEVYPNTFDAVEATDAS